MRINLKKLWLAPCAMALLFTPFLIGELNGERVCAQTAPAQEAYLASTTLRTASATNSARLSAFDGISVTRNKTSATASWGTLDMRFRLSHNDFSQLEETWLRLFFPHDVTTNKQGVDICIVDGNNVVNAWNSGKPEDSTGKIYSAVAESDNPAESGAREDAYLSYAKTKVLADSQRWYIYPKNQASQLTSLSQYSQTAGQSFDWTNVQYLLVRVPIGAGVYDLNIGEMYGKKTDGSFVSLFDMQDITLGQSASDDVYYRVTDGVLEKDATVLLADIVNDYTVARMAKNQITFQEGVGEWQLINVKNLPTDLSAYNGFSYYVDLTNCQGLDMNQKLMDNAGENEWETWRSEKQTVIFYPEDGSPQFFGSINKHPAGFKGRVVVPFSAFRTQSGAVKDNVLDTSALKGELGFIVWAKNCKGSMILDDLQFITDAKTIITVEQHLQNPMGDFGSPDSMGIYKQEIVAGLDEFIAEEIEGYAFDKSNENNKLNYFTNPTDKNYVKEGLYGSGKVAGSYRPIVYYKLIPVDIQKIYGMEEVQDSYPAETGTKEILESFPKDGIAVSNTRGDLLQLQGEWKATARDDNSLTVEFIADSIPETLKDGKGLLKKVITLVAQEGGETPEIPDDKPTPPAEEETPEPPTEPTPPVEEEGCGSVTAGFGAMAFALGAVLTVCRKGGKKHEDN